MFRGAPERLVADIVARRSEFRLMKLHGLERGQAEMLMPREKKHTTAGAVSDANA
jgi:hypothetical protein